LRCLCQHGLRFGSRLGRGGGLGRDWQRLEDSFQGAVEGLWRCSVLSCSRKQWGEVVASDTVHAIRGDRARPISAISGHYSGAARANIGSRMPILGVRVTGHWRLITGHCYSYRDDNTKYTHLTVCCTAAFPASCFLAGKQRGSHYSVRPTSNRVPKVVAHGPWPMPMARAAPAHHDLSCSPTSPIPDQTRPDQTRGRQVEDSRWAAPT
jgi:hypothetical protein